MNDPEPQIIGSASARGRVESVLDMKQQRQVLAASRAVLKVEAIPADVAKLFRPRAPELIEKITDRIQKEVAAFAGPPRGRRRNLIHFAVDSAVTQFLDIVENKPSSALGVHELFRRMGYAEAVAANDLDAMRAAYHVATRDSFAEFRLFVQATGMPPHHLVTLLDAILTYIEQLILQASVGYVSALQGIQRPMHEARRRLLTELLAGRPFDQLDDHIDEAGWQPPEHPAVVIAEITAPAYVPALPRGHEGILIGLRGQRLMVLGNYPQVEEIAEGLAKLPGIEHVTVSWPLPIEEIRDAYRWTCRALDLAAKGVIEQDGVIYCAKYRDLLWLHADPRLSHHACIELLGPLEKEKPYHRLVLAETLLLWLQTRDSVPALADRMDVHGQTVRHRVKRLRELFGDQLLDPHRTLALLSALELTVPRWREAHRKTRRKAGAERP